jgi:hypothetical protein
VIGSGEAEQVCSRLTIILLAVFVALDVFLVALISPCVSDAIAGGVCWSLRESHLKRF